MTRRDVKRAAWVVAAALVVVGWWKDDVIATYESGARMCLSCIGLE